MDDRAGHDVALGEAERLAVLYAPRALRDRYRTLFLLDARLARIVLNVREPALAQIKLAWWRDELATLGEETRVPMLADLRQAWLGDMTALVGLVDGWEEMVAGEGGGIL